MLLPQLYRRSLLAVAIAIAAGYAGNYFSLPLLFGVDFLFGSIAVLLVVRFCGAGWGTLQMRSLNGWAVLYAAIHLPYWDKW